MVRAVLVAVFLCACGGNTNGNGGTDAGTCDPPCDPGRYCSAAGTCVTDGTCLVDADCADDQFCSAAQTCVADGACAVDDDCGGGMKCNAGACELGGCGGTALDLTYVAPNFIIVLDRSCSMRTVLTGTTTSKWAAAVGALDKVLTDYSADIRWGLTLFPDTLGDRCTQDAIPLPIADNQATAIKALLNAALDTTDPLFPDGPCVTNIDTGITQAVTDPALADATRASYVMLVSDGAQAGCSAAGGDAGTEAAIADLLATRGIQTFVVGFGSAVDAAQLDAFAVAGGTALAGAPKYYQADSAAQLDQAFQTIANIAIGCEYTVDPAPSDIDQMYVYFSNTELVPRDTGHANGWDYEPATKKLTLYGTFCERLESHEVTDVDVIFGCPVPPID